MNEQTRIDQLEKRIQQLEQEVRLLKGEKNHEWNTEYKQSTIIQNDSDKTEFADKEPVDWEHVLGKVWLPRIFIFVLIIGVVWGFKATFDRGFITEPVRVALGYFIACGFVILGELQIRKKRERLGQVLLAGSIILFMLSTFAAHVLYGYFPFVLAAVLNLFWIAGGVFFAHRHRSQALAVLSSAGGVFIPFLLESTGLNTGLFVTYEVLLYGAFLYYGMRNQYTILHYVSFWLLHIAFIASLVFNPISELDAFSYGAMVQHMFLFVLFMGNKLNHPTQTISSFSSFLLMAGWIALGITEWQQQWYYLGFAGLYGAGAVWYLSKDKDRFALSAGIATFAFMFAVMEIFQSDTMPVLLLIEGAIALWIGFRFSIHFQTILALFPYGFGLFLTLTEPIEQVLSWPTLSWTVMVGSLLFVTHAMKRYNAFQKTDLLKGLFYANILLPLIWLTQISYAATKEWDLNVQHLFSSLAWSIYAVGFIAYGIIKQEKPFRLTGISLLFATLVKVIGVDLSDISLEFRALLFTILGATGLGVSRMIYVKEKQSKKEG